MPKPRIAVPVPYSQDREYAERALPQYLAAIEQAGGEPVVITLDPPPEDLARRLMACEGVLLPGSKADLDPEKYGAQRHPATHPADPLRDNVDELLVQDAYNMRKPVFAICYGLQMLNVWRTGTLVQDIESELGSHVPHTAGRKLPRAHMVAVDPASRLAQIVGEYLEQAPALRDDGMLGRPLEVNSSHHQAVATVGDGLRVAAVCPVDNVIEALEGTLPGHWVLGVQWHPERSYADDSASRALFTAFIQACAVWKPQSLPASAARGV
jgi:putative glutamine amidotransferase